MDYGEAVSHASVEGAAIGAMIGPVLSRLSAEANTAELREEIEKKLDKMSRRIVVVIDDLDRL